VKNIQENQHLRQCWAILAGQARLNFTVFATEDKYLLQNEFGLFTHESTGCR
jgi:hypothetical protein